MAMNKFIFLSLISFSFFQAEACTGIKMIAKDNSFVHGRTLEFGMVIDLSLAYIPAGVDFASSTDKGEGLKYKSKYASVGAIAFDQLAILDGMNEKGLAVGAFYFPTFAEYAPLTAENQSKALSPIDFTNWLVTQFATVEEVKAALSDVSIVPTVGKGWGSTPPPFHYVVYDKSGKCLVIEPIKGKLVSYDNDLGVITNSPPFDWHITNLRNYLNLNPYNAKPLELRNLDLKPLGQGTGLLGLPGDFTPPARFVRATLYSTQAIPVPSHVEAVPQAFHILNQFDIPLGSVRQKEDGTTASEFTQITTVRDPQNLKIFFKTYDEQLIKEVDLSQLKGNSIKKFKIDGKFSPENLTQKLTNN